MPEPLTAPDHSPAAQRQPDRRDTGARQFLVECADSQTGEVRFRTVPAANEEQAREIANSMGYLVGRVSGPSPAPAANAPERAQGVPPPSYRFEKIFVGGLFAAVAVGLFLYFYIEHLIYAELEVGGWKDQLVDAQGELIREEQKAQEAARWVRIEAQLARRRRAYTEDHYHRLQIGMSMGEVFEIMGGMGREVSSSGAVGMYQYANTDGSGITLMFDGAQLYSKSQFGLD